MAATANNQIQAIIDGYRADGRCQYKFYNTKPDGKVACLALGKNYQDIQQLAQNIDNTGGEITGIFFQKVDNGRVKPAVDNDMFSRVNWTNSPINVRRLGYQGRVHIDLNNPALQVAAPLRAEWIDFATTMSRSRDAMLQEMTRPNNRQPANLLKAFQILEEANAVDLETVIERVQATHGHYTDDMNLRLWAEAVVCMGCEGIPASELAFVFVNMFPECRANNLNLKVVPSDSSMNITIQAGVPHCLNYGYAKQIIEDARGVADLGEEEPDEENQGGEQNRGRHRQRVLLPKRDARSRSRSPVTDPNIVPQLEDSVVCINPNNPASRNPDIYGLLNNPDDYLLSPSIYFPYFEQHKPDLALIWKKAQSNQTKKHCFLLKFVCEITPWNYNNRRFGRLETMVDEATEKCVQSCLAALAYNQVRILGIVIVVDGMKLIKIERSQDTIGCLLNIVYKTISILGSLYLDEFHTIYNYYNTQDTNGFIYDIEETPFAFWNNIPHLYVFLGMIQDAIVGDVI